MATFSSRHMQCVVALADLSSAEGAEWTTSLTQTSATGFLYAFPHSGNIQDETVEYRRLWLVTCKHVIHGLSSDGSGEMIVRMNQLDQQNMVMFTIPLLGQEGVPRWYFHPTKDIAVIPTSWQDLEDKNVRWETFAAGRNAVTRRDAADLGLSEGDPVFILGFPTGWREGRQDYPIVRHGILAQARGWLKGEHETFLVDGSGFPGNSGGPVIVATPQVDALIGMVSASEISPLIVQGLGGTVEGLEETADLIEVIPMESINETIEFVMELESQSI